MDLDMAMSPEPGANNNPGPSRPTTSDSSSNSYTMPNSRRARSASTSSSATNFATSVDAFGLAASPSAHSPKHSWLATRPLAFPPQWATSGSSGMPPMPLGVSPTTASMSGSPLTYTAPPMDLTMPGPSQHAQSHGVLPSASLMGGSSLRLNRPSLLSLQTSAGDQEIDRDGKRAHGTIEEEDLEELGPEPETDTEGNAAEFVKRWRNRLEPSPTIRRVQSACGTPRSSVSPFAMNGMNDLGNASGSGSVSPTARLHISMRRASSDQSIGTRPDLKKLMEGVRKDPNGNGDSARAEAFPRSGMFGKDKGKGKEKMSFSSGGSGGSRDGESPRRSLPNPDGKKVPARLPPNLRATLAAEKDIAGQEIRSEALLQRLILSNPSSLPITPRPSRYHRNRAMSTFSSALSQSSNSMSGDSSDDEGSFTADDMVEREVTPAIEPGWSAGMEVDMMTPGTTAMAGGTGTPLDTPGPSGSVPLQSEAGFSSRRGPSGRSSMNSLHSFGGMKMDERKNGIGNSMTWRESPSAATRSNKRKATFEDSRYEPYGKRLRGSPADNIQHSPGMSTSLPHSPLQWQSALPTVPMSPMSSSGLDHESNSGRSYSRPQSRSGSPGLISGMQMQMMTRPGASPATSSPLNSHASINGNPVALTGFGPSNALAGSSTHVQPHANAHGRPMVGMGGLGMLLLSKRNANSITTGMGLIGKNGVLGMEGEGDAVVAERMGGMDFAGLGSGLGPSERRSSGGGMAEYEDEDKMVFD